MSTYDSHLCGCHLGVIIGGVYSLGSESESDGVSVRKSEGETIDALHNKNYEAQYNFWLTNGSNVDIKSYMDYDPYLGRITEPSTPAPEG